MFVEIVTSYIQNIVTRENFVLQLFRKDLISAMKMADTEQLDAEDYLLIADPWRQDWEKGVQVPVNEESTNDPNIKWVLRRVQSNREFDEGAQTNKTFFKLSVLGIVLPASFFDKSLYCEIHLIHSHKYFPKSVIYYICMNMNNFRWLF